MKARRNSALWSYYVDAYRVSVLVISFSWLAFTLIDWSDGENPFTWRSLGWAVGVLMAVALRPHLAEPAIAKPRTRLHEMRSRFRRILISIFALAGVLVGISAPIDFESLPQSQDLIASAAIFSVLAASVAWAYCKIHPITMP